MLFKVGETLIGIFTAFLLIRCCRTQQEDSAKQQEDLVKQQEDLVRQQPKTNCSLNAGAAYPWLVKIWDKDENRATMHGSIIGTVGIISACDTFTKVDTPSVYEIIAFKLIQTLDSDKFEQDTCSQTQLVATIFPHPKCAAESSKGARRCGSDKKEVNQYFCLAVWQLISPFHVELLGNDGIRSYPELITLMDPVELLVSILTINQAKNSSCFIPYFDNPQSKLPLLNSSSMFSEVLSVHYRSNCSYIICQDFEEEDGIPAITCEAQELKHYVTGSRLCFTSSHIKHFPFFQKNVGLINYYGGAALTCNGTSYGVVGAQHGVIPRIERKNDIFVVITFLRMLPWINQMRERMGAAWKYSVGDVYVGKQEIKEPEDLAHNWYGIPTPMSLKEVSYAAVVSASTAVHFSFNFLCISYLFMIFIPLRFFIFNL